MAIIESVPPTPASHQSVHDSPPPKQDTPLTPFSSSGIAPTISRSAMPSEHSKDLVDLMDFADDDTLSLKSPRSATPSTHISSPAMLDLMSMDCWNDIPSNLSDPLSLNVSRGSKIEHGIEGNGIKDNTNGEDGDQPLKEGHGYQAKSEEERPITPKPKAADNQLGETESARRLRATASPFQSKSIKVVRNGTSPSFFPPEGNQQDDRTPPSSPTALRRSSYRSLAPSPDSRTVHHHLPRPYTSYGSANEAEITKSSPSFHSLPINRPIRISTPPPIEKVSKTDQVTASPTMMAGIKSEEAKETVDQLEDEEEASEDDDTASISSIAQITRSFSTWSLNPDGSETPPVAAHSNNHAASPKVPLQPETVFAAQASINTAAMSDSELEPEKEGRIEEVEAQEDTGLYVNTALDEVAQLSRSWDEYRDAYGKLSGSLEEVMVRLTDAFAGHTCAESSSDLDRQELARLRKSNHQLSKRVEELIAEKRLRDKDTTRRQSENAGLESRLLKVAEEYKKIKKDTREAKKAEEEFRGRHDKLLDNYHILNDDRQHWHKRELVLQAEYMKLEDKVSELDREKNDLQLALKEYELNGKLNSTPPAPKFVAVILHCESGNIDFELIKRGAAGGVTLADALIGAVSERVGKVPDLDIVLQIYLDIAIFKKNLMEEGIIKKHHEVHNFLDGFNSRSNHTSVVDCEYPTERAGAHANLFLQLGAKILLLGGAKETYASVFEDADESQKSAVFAIWDGKTTSELHDVVGDSHMLPIPYLDWSTARQSSKETATPVTARTENTLVRPDPAAGQKKKPPIHPSRVRMVDHTRPAARSSTFMPQPATELRTVAPLVSPPTGNPRPQRPYPDSPPTEMQPPPWNTKTLKWKSKLKIEPQTPTPLNVPYWELGGTLLDEVNQKNAAAGLQSSPVSPGAISLNSTPRNYTESLHSATSPTPKRRPWADRVERTPAPGPTLRIPVDDLGSLAGSPPESDEDHPNVDLPHSSYKAVQRPMQYNASSATESIRSRTSSISSSVTNEAKPPAGRTSKPPNSLASRITSRNNASITGTNNTPLGARKTPETIGGFKFRVAGAGR